MVKWANEDTKPNGRGGGGNVGIKQAGSLTHEVRDKFCQTGRVKC